MQVDYDTKLGKIEYRNGLYTLLINSFSNQIVKIPLINKRVPSNGLFLGEQLVNENLKIKAVLELGAGKYAPASFCLLATNKNIVVDAIEVQLEECVFLREIIALNNLKDRFKVYQGNLFNAFNDSRKKYDLIYSNIAQLPLRAGEISSFHDHGGVDGWCLLDVIIKQSSKFLSLKGYIALMVFDFLGIERRNNSLIPSLFERLVDRNFSVVKRVPYMKELRTGGETHKSLDYILEVYPEANFYNRNHIKIDPFKYLKNGLPVFLNFSYVISRLKA